MASDIDTAKAEPRAARRFWPTSRLGRLIVALNLLGLAILIAGALISNELRRGLIRARIDSLVTQESLIAHVMGDAATRGFPEPGLEADKAIEILRLLNIPPTERARLFDAEGRLLADSYLVGDRVEWRPLPPPPGSRSAPLRWMLQDKGATDPGKVAAAQKELQWEIGRALKGETVSGLRHAQNGGKVVSVSMPVQRVQAVLGVLTLDAGGVDETVAAQRRALIPFVLLAVGVTLLSSFLLTWLVARPVTRLARAADQVRLSNAREISLPGIARRDDELGDLTRSLQAMTAEMVERMEAIERFAADVAHEIRNPLTSIRSAVETFDLVKEPEARRRLLAILKQDVGRLDRLITDISNFSRLDAELSRESPRTLDLNRLLADICRLYGEARGQEDPVVVFRGPEISGPIAVLGREGPLSQVFRNLIDNARSFSPPGGQVRVALLHGKGRVLIRIADQGPGVPPENLETIFQRFYTARPKGAAFGGHSGLGLSIARQIVTAHGGRIWAENRTSPEGKIIGARFMITLPEARA